jgi:hypothetical protein
MIPLSTKLNIIALCVLIALTVLFIHSELAHPEGCDFHHDLHDFCTLASAILLIKIILSFLFIFINYMCWKDHSTVIDIFSHFEPIKVYPFQKKPTPGTLIN